MNDRVQQNAVLYCGLSSFHGCLKNSQFRHSSSDVWWMCYKLLHSAVLEWWIKDFPWKLFSSFIFLWFALDKIGEIASLLEQLRTIAQFYCYNLFVQSETIEFFKYCQINMHKILQYMVLASFLNVKTGFMSGCSVHRLTFLYFSLRI